MSKFEVTKDRRVILDGTEIKRVLSVDVHLEGGENPEVLLRVPVDEVDVDCFTDWAVTKEAAP